MRYFEGFESFCKAQETAAKHVVMRVWCGEKKWEVNVPYVALDAVQQDITNAAVVGDLTLWVKETETLVILPYAQITGIELSLSR